jgi:hypothetical protein
MVTPSILFFFVIKIERKEGVRRMELKHTIHLYFFGKRNNVPDSTQVYSLQLLHNSALQAETREMSLIQ